ncbi:uncharacterized protein VDAG_07459 [Verticillium dahliae VdLs.17]|uniref:Uncharacterized protein n=1 Tax=Verticillium dahliae (strain VdLs.17 / ATCC MYA-4575 / FGSC 10137) TaxID=498257 RepID=G2XB29_VERDV|nr:uncharacterized protein VDAG_07459 [Verticillium dahliae VdLs.17]EGY16295.1 hypothetical protein VDAG_07459 [Verticillium dahliae VdLs.17]KAF3359881.1 hypothetical protein VdG1_04956 [Verticillium dahliae VDG1]KAH6702614.1 hypothetical protein EV126DRAFT_231320 [Verticillium dahliae]
MGQGVGSAAVRNRNTCTDGTGGNTSRFDPTKGCDGTTQGFLSLAVNVEDWWTTRQKKPGIRPGMRPDFLPTIDGWPLHFSDHFSMGSKLEMADSIAKELNTKMRPGAVASQPLHSASFRARGHL